MGQGTGHVNGIPAHSGHDLQYRCRFRATDDRPAIRVDLCGRQAAPNEPNRYLPGCQSWGWKGEWWAFGGTSIYSHTAMPGRYPCDYSDQREDGRGTITLVNATSNHPGGQNVLFMDGSVRFIKTSVNIIAWQAIGTTNNNEVVSMDAL